MQARNSLYPSTCARELASDPKATGAHIEFAMHPCWRRGVYEFNPRSKALAAFK
jgi:hypothetical protein